MVESTRPEAGIASSNLAIRSMRKHLRAAVVSAVVVLTCVGSFVIGATFQHSPDGRFAVEIAKMPGVRLASVSGSEVSAVSFDRDVEVDEILAVRDRLEEAEVDANLDVAGVHGDEHDLEAIAPTMIAVAQIRNLPASVRVREVSGKVWIEATFAHGATPMDGVAAVLPILQGFAENGVPDGVVMVGANTVGEQLDLVRVGPEALQDLDGTISSLADIKDGTRTGAISCGEDASGICSPAP